MNKLYKKITLILGFLILASFVLYFFIIPFLYNNIFAPIAADDAISVIKSHEGSNEVSKDEDFTYFDNSGNIITIWNFKKNVPNIENSFFKENLSGELFYESTDSKNDKFEFKIVEFNKIDNLQYKLRVRKAKLEETELNNRKYLNYLLQLENSKNKLRIKMCELISIETN